jgi:transposase-like protein
MEPEVSKAEELRKRFEAVRASGAASQVRAAAVAYYRVRAKEGATQEVAAGELGLTRWTLAKWHQMQDPRAGRAPAEPTSGAPAPASEAVATLRRAVEGLGPRNPSRRFPAELKQRITEWARGEVAEGRGRNAIAEQVGVPWETLAKWLGTRASEKAELKTVRVVGGAPIATIAGASCPVLRCPGGFVVEGLDIPALVEVLKRLG